MYICSLQRDCWDGKSNVDEKIEHPTSDQVESAILELDNRKRTLVTLTSQGDAHIAIGGGCDDRYFVYVTFDNEEFFGILNENNNDNMVELNVGGQVAEYSNKFIVSITTAIAAANTFALTGELDANLVWSNDV